MAKAKKLKSGSWRVLVYDFTDKDKKRHYKSFTANTKKEAEYLAAEYSVSRSSSNYENMTLREAYKRYIEVKSDVLAPSTLRDYNSKLNNDFPYIMYQKINKITQEQIQDAINIEAAKTSPKTVRNKHGLLVSVFKMFRPDFVITTRLPQKIKNECTIPTTKQINLLISQANPRMRVPILLSSSGGLRRSEICALTLSDVTDLGVTINKALVLNNEKKWVIKPPKTNAGYRFVPLPQKVISELRDWEYLGKCQPTYITNKFKRLANRLNINTNFHKLRHYFASECHAKGIPDQYIISVGGWESVDMLHKIYQHTISDESQNFNSKIVNLFNEQLKCNTKCNTD